MNVGYAQSNVVGTIGSVANPDLEIVIEITAMYTDRYNTTVEYNVFAPSNSITTIKKENTNTVLFTQNVTTGWTSINSSFTLPFAMGAYLECEVCPEDGGDCQRSICIVVEDDEGANDPNDN